MKNIKLVIIIIISLLWGGVIFHNTIGKSINKIDTLYVTTVNSKSVMIPLDAINKGMKIQENFQAQYNNLENIQVIVGNFNRVNNTKTCFSITNLKTNEIIEKQCQNNTNFQNGAQYTLKFKNQKFSKKENFKLNIYSPNGTNTNSVTLIAIKNSSPNSQLYVNGKLQPINLYMIENYNANYSTNYVINSIYKIFYPQNPYILKGYYIYLLILLYPLAILTPIILGELFLYKERIVNILISNIIIAVLIFIMSYSISHIQDLNIACYLVYSSCTSNTK